MYLNDEKGKEDKKNQDLTELFLNIAAGVVAIVGVYVLQFNKTNTSDVVVKEKDYTPAFISVQECDILSVDGNDSSYNCKEIEKLKIRPEVYSHFQELEDRCTAPLNNDKIIVCYDIEKDKIKDIKNRKKIGMDCIITKENEKLKCVRKF